MLDALHTQEIPEDQTVFPSPEDLSGYVLVKVLLLSVVVNINSLTGLLYDTIQYDV